MEIYKINKAIRYYLYKLSDDNAQEQRRYLLRAWLRRKDGDIDPELLRHIFNDIAPEFWLSFNNKEAFCIVADELLKAGKVTFMKKVKPHQKMNKEQVTATIYPENQTTKTVAEITFCENKYTVQVRSPKDDTIISVLKSHGYKWYGVWEKSLIRVAHDIDDRMAEIGNALLVAGVPVIIYDESIRQKAISGEFKDACTRWIGKIDDGHAFIWWEKVAWEDRYKDDTYSNAKSIPSSKWEDGGFIVETRYYDEIIDFAKINNFEITSAAQKALKDAEQTEKKIKTVPIVHHEVQEQKKYNVKDILNSNRDILADLRDDK